MLPFLCRNMLSPCKGREHKKLIPVSLFFSILFIMHHIHLVSYI